MRDMKWLAANWGRVEKLQSKLEKYMNGIDFSNRTPFQIDLDDFVNKYIKLVMFTAKKALIKDLKEIHYLIDDDIIYPYIKKSGEKEIIFFYDYVSGRNPRENEWMLEIEDLMMQIDVSAVIVMIEKEWKES